MQYQITSDNIQMSSSMEILAKGKVAKLENQLMQVPEDSRLVRVVMNTAPNDMFLVKLLTTVYGKEYFTEEIEYTLESALVKAVDEMERMLKKDRSVGTTQDWEEAREAKRLNPENIEEALDELPEA